jgi:malate synthase
MDGKMEDAATAEISRGLLWQWVARGVVLECGARVDIGLVDAVIRGEVDALRADNAEPRSEVVDLLRNSIFSSEPPENIFVGAYEILDRLVVDLKK